MKERKIRQPGALTTKHWMGYMFGDFGGDSDCLVDGAYLL